MIRKPSEYGIDSKMSDFLQPILCSNGPTIRDPNIAVNGGSDALITDLRIAL